VADVLILWASTPGESSPSSGGIRLSGPDGQSNRCGLREHALDCLDSPVRASVDDPRAHAGVSGSRVLPFLAVPAPPGPGHRFQARLANLLPAFSANAKFLVPNPSQGIVNGAQELAVCLLQSDLYSGVVFAGGHVDRVPAKLTCGGDRIDQTLAGGEFLPL
jgi:hypothetical protein